MTLYNIECLIVNHGYAQRIKYKDRDERKNSAPFNEKAQFFI